MNRIQKHNTIMVNHLQRKSIIYVRQSSEKQVLNNKESQHLQYALQDRAKAFGWRKVEIIDEDLGKSAATGAQRREGFERLITTVTLGEVGIIFSREVSRLSRTNKDWCHLFEVCGLFDTLIGDEEHIYDPNNIDDQLVLGIKATMSIVELKILKMRMIAGMENKAKRGELKRILPPGYLWDETGKIVKDPDKRVQESMILVFSKFKEIGSIRQTYLWFQNNAIELPVNKFVSGKRRLIWQLPTKSFIRDVLQNPCYAGAYVWGRRITRNKYEDGRIIKRMSTFLKPEESRVLIKDHHEGYIDWKSFEENQDMITKNSLHCSTDERVGAAREGQGLLAGLLRCGHCGRKIHVRYWGRQGTAARYMCKGDFDSGGRYCIAFGGSLVDRRFSKELLEVLSPYGVAASIKAYEMLLSSQESEECVFENKLKQVSYEERRAFEQYNEVDPHNRLVADELERRWNAKLEELSRVKEESSKVRDEKISISTKEQKALIKLGEDFASVWESKFCQPSTKKKILRTVIKEVVVRLCHDTNELIFVIHWKGGCHTSFSMKKPAGSKDYKTHKEDIEIISKLSVRYGDDEIARVLSKLGRRTGKGNRWNEFRVKSARVRNGIPGHKRTVVDADVLSLGKASRYCNVSHKTIEKLVAKGILPKKQIVPLAPWEISKSDLDSEQVRKIISHLHKTGKFILDVDRYTSQLSLFEKALDDVVNE